MPHPFLARAALTALLVAAVGCSKPEGNRRHLVLVTLDTSRADFFGSWGRPGDPTPHFDALAAEGVRFALALSTSAVTPVSHATILTGLLPDEHGLRVLLAEGGYRVRRDVPTLALVLKDAGYRTIAVHSAFPVSSTFGFADGFDVFESFDVDLQQKGQSVGWDTTSAQRRSDETTDIALRELQQAEGPVFLWVHYWDPHDPAILPPEELIPDDAPRLEQGYPPSSLLYQAELSYVDSQFGRLLEGLRELGLYDDAVVAVVADHGEGLEDGQERHGWSMHRELYQEQLHVPLILRTPDGPRGRVVEELVSTVDLYPTVLEALALEPPRPVTGRSLFGMLDGSDAGARVAFADQINYFDFNASMVTRRPQASFVFAVTDGRWKLIYRPTHPGQSELFDLSADPLELEDRFDDVGVRPERLRLMELLAERAPWVLEPFAAEGGGDSGAVSGMLQSLGYTRSEEDLPPVRWTWICPEHGDERAPESGRCPRCQRALLPTGRFE